MANKFIRLSKCLANNFVINFAHAVGWMVSQRIHVHIFTLKSTASTTSNRAIHTTCITSRDLCVVFHWRWSTSFQPEIPLLLPYPRFPRLKRKVISDLYLPSTLCPLANHNFSGNRQRHNSISINFCMLSVSKRGRERERVQYAFHHQFTRPVTNKRQNSNIPTVTFNPTPLSDFSLTQIIVH